MKIGIDIGGRHIGIGLIDDKYNIVKKTEIDLPKDKTNKNMQKLLIESIIMGINKVTTNNKITSIGISCCGTIKDNEIARAENLSVKNFKIVEELKKHFNVSITIRNDTMCAALAEKKLGILKEYQDAVFLTIGTGIGGAAFIGNKLLKPTRYSGFEFGHMKISNEGAMCSCGNIGCFESYARMDVLKQAIRENYNIKNDISGEEYVELIEKELNSSKGDIEKINKILDKYASNISIGISNIVNIFEPQVICIGGGFSYYSKFLLDKIKENMVLINKGEKPELISAILKNDAGIIGAVIPVVPMD